MEKDIANTTSRNVDTRITVTVFTPTYNRRHTLERTYRSLQEQTFRDFEWLIVDDGSTDDTASLVAEWQKEDNFFPVLYHRKQNGGKHTAHNFVLPLARGEYFAILDSDDWYLPETLTILLNAWASMPLEIKHQFSNIEGLCSYSDGRTVGHSFPGDVYDSNYIEMQKTHSFDTKGMYRTDVLKLYPFPDNYEGCFVPEALIWNRMAAKFKTRYISKIVGYTEYMPDGLSNRSLKAGFTKSEPAVVYHREMSLIRSFPMLKRLKCKANVYRYAFHNRLSILKELSEERFKLPGIVFAGIGYLVYIKDRVALYREELTRVRGCINSTSVRNRS